MVAKNLPDLGEQLGAREMAMGIVDGLKVIEIEEHERELIAVSLGTVDFSFKNRVQVPSVVKAGAIIGNGQFMDALHVPRIFEGNRCKIRQSLEQGQVSLVKSFTIDAVNQLDNAQTLISKKHWNGDDR